MDRTDVEAEAVRDIVPDPRHVATKLRIVEQRISLGQAMRADAVKDQICLRGGLVGVHYELVGFSSIQH
jgi:hypothetical protein